MSLVSPLENRKNRGLSPVFRRAGTRKQSWQQGKSLGEFACERSAEAAPRFSKTGRARRIQMSELLTPTDSAGVEKHFKWLIFINNIRLAEILRLDTRHYHIHEGKGTIK
jgi:hypothetical protein